MRGCLYVATAIAACAISVPSYAQVTPGIPGPGGTAPAGTRAPTSAEIDAARRALVGESLSSILTPEDIVSLRGAVIRAQGAQSGVYAPAPKVTPRVISVGGDRAGASPPTITLAFGIVTPITFVDDRSNPWPVSSIAYDPRVFSQDGQGCGSSVQAPGGAERPATLNIMPCRSESYGNFSVELEGYTWPIVVMAKSGMDATALDLPITVKVKGTSPLTPTRVAGSGAAPSPVSFAAAATRTTAGDNALALFGAGTPPAGAARARVTGAAGVSAWIYQNHLYLRGRMVVVNPPHDATADTPDGVHVWRIARPVSRVLVMLEDGAETPITIDW